MSISVDEITKAALEVSRLAGEAIDGGDGPTAQALNSASSSLAMAVGCATMWAGRKPKVKDVVSK